MPKKAAAWRMDNIQNQPIAKIKNHAKMELQDKFNFFYFPAFSTEFFHLKHGIVYIGISEVADSSESTSPTYPYTHMGYTTIYYHA